MLQIINCTPRVLTAEMGRPVTIRMAYCDPMRLSEEQPDEYETVVHPGSGMAVRLYVGCFFRSSAALTERPRTDDLRFQRRR